MNTQLQGFYVVTKDFGNFTTGEIIGITGEVKDTLPVIFADGRILKKKSYPKIDQIFKDSYSYETVKKDFYWLNKLLGRDTCIKVRNCKEDEFRIPDLRAKVMPNFVGKITKDV